MTLPDPKNYQKSTLIPKLSPINPNLDDIETKQFLISFKHYNHKECEIKQLKQSPAKKALVVLKQVGSLTNLSEFRPKNIKTSLIKATGEYKKLFKTLPKSPDIDLLEFDIGSAERLFFFIVSQIFYLVAIKSTHLEYSKGRRR
ncbi:hypothetical protein GF354_03885 [Candidatus Peregrinibacteria bacterium]|nr:hypothetical protein [Candidatus Peregrinibacteria bacterium]